MPPPPSPLNESDYFAYSDMRGDKIVAAPGAPSPKGNRDMLKRKSLQSSFAQQKAVFDAGLLEVRLDRKADGSATGLNDSAVWQQHLREDQALRLLGTT